MRKLLTLTIVAFATLGFVADVLADPPPWAPAHGYHKNKGKKAKYYVGFSGNEYGRDFEVPAGRCDREQVGAVIGGVIGGAVGNKVSDRDNRVVGTILGAAIGALLGAQIGRSMDDRDRGCFGHTLELGTSGRAVTWTNPSNHWRYELTPGNAITKGDRRCRSFELQTANGKHREKSTGVACPVQPGVWELVRP